MSEEEIHEMIKNGLDIEICFDEGDRYTDKPDNKSLEIKLLYYGEVIAESSTNIK